MLRGGEKSYSYTLVNIFQILPSIGEKFAMEMRGKRREGGDTRGPGVFCEIQNGGIADGDKPTGKLILSIRS